MFFKLNKDTLINITKAFLLLGFLWLNFAQGKNAEKQNTAAIYYLQHPTVINKTRPALPYPKKSATINNSFLIQGRMHRTLVNHSKIKMLHMPASFKNRVKNSNGVHAKYTFSRNFSIINPKAGYLFSAINSGQATEDTKVLAVQMLKDKNPAGTTEITFSVTDSQGEENDGVTLSCGTIISSISNCTLQTNEHGVAKVTIINNVGGDVIVTATAPDGSAQKYKITFNSRYKFIGSMTYSSTESLTNKHASVGVTIEKNGAITSGVAVNWTLMATPPENAWITPTSYTNNLGIATAYVSNSVTGAVRVTATAPDGTTKDIASPISFSGLQYKYNVIQVPDTLLPGTPALLSVNLLNKAGAPANDVIITWESPDNNLKIVAKNGASIASGQVKTVDGVSSIYVKAATTGIYTIKASFTANKATVSIEKTLNVNQLWAYVLEFPSKEISNPATYQGEVKLCKANAQTGVLTACRSAFLDKTKLTAGNIPFHRITSIDIDRVHSKVYIFEYNDSSTNMSVELCDINSQTAKLINCKRNQFSLPDSIYALYYATINPAASLIYMIGTGSESFAFDACPIQSNGNISACIKNTLPITPYTDSAVFYKTKNSELEQVYLFDEFKKNLNSCNINLKPDLNSENIKTTCSIINNFIDNPKNILIYPKDNHAYTLIPGPEDSTHQGVPLNFLNKYQINSDTGKLDTTNKQKISLISLNENGAEDTTAYFTIPATIRTSIVNTQFYMINRNKYSSGDFRPFLLTACSIGDDNVTCTKNDVNPTQGNVFRDIAIIAMPSK